MRTLRGVVSFGTTLLRSSHDSVDLLLGSVEMSGDHANGFGLVAAIHACVMDKFLLDAVVVVFELLDRFGAALATARSSTFALPSGIQNRQFKGPHESICEVNGEFSLSGIVRESFSYATADRNPSSFVHQSISQSFNVFLIEHPEHYEP